MIGIDWGTSNLRAYRMGANGQVLARRRDTRGILSVEPGGFPGVLLDLIGPWLQEGETRVLLAGMVGSKQGWAEAPYLSCPAGIADIARATLVLPALPGFEAVECRIVPGATCRDEFALPDVMRGEETQIAALAANEPGRMLVCLPGTHSKWAEVEGGRIVGFRTFMTGEIFAVLRNHSILGRTIEGDTYDTDAFERGAALSLASSAPSASANILHRLFSVRTLALKGELAGPMGASYLSGLLIGEEVAAMRSAFAEDNAIELIGSDQLMRLYEHVLEMAGALPILRDSDIITEGLHAIGGMVPWQTI